jgi:glutamine synthetase
MATSEPDHSDLFRQLEAHNVLFINILFTDALGELKSVEIPVMQFKGALGAGISFDGSSVRGYADIANADMYLKPDLATLKIYPWLTQGQSQDNPYATAGMIADVYTTDGIPSSRSPRYILSRFLQEATECGNQFFIAVEPEFFLFPQGKVPTSRSEVTSRAGYFALVPGDTEEAVRKEIVASLLKMGIPIEKSHHEIEPYINELSPPNTDSRPCLCQSLSLDSPLAGCMLTSRSLPTGITPFTIPKTRWGSHSAHASSSGD